MLLITNGTQTFTLTTFINTDSPDLQQQTPVVGYISPSVAFTHPVSGNNRPEEYFDFVTSKILSLRLFELLKWLLILCFEMAIKVIDQFLFVPNIIIAHCERIFTKSLR